METRVTFAETNGNAICRIYTADKEEISKCGMYTSSDRSWNINTWYTTEKYKHQGYGKIVMKEMAKRYISKHGNPSAVIYTWNGANAYVLDWLTENFDAICNCPLAVQKNNSDDDWDSHQYTLNLEKFLAFVRS